MDNLLNSRVEADRPIREFISKRLIGIESNSTIQEAASRMVEFNISSLIILNREGKPVGIITDADLKEKVVAEGLPSDTPVDEVMTRDLITIDINSKLKKVFELMSEKKIKHVPVTEKGEIVGIITFRDLIDIERSKMETYISRE